MSKINKKENAKGVKCKRCGMSKDSKEFYGSRVITDASPNGHLTICKTCVGNTYKAAEPGTFMHFLYALDIPWMPSVYKNVLSKATGNINSIANFGKYIAMTKMVQYQKYGFEDSNQWQLDNLDAEDIDFIDNYTYKMPVEEPVTTVAKASSNFSIEGLLTDAQERQTGGSGKRDGVPAEETNYEALLTNEEREYLQAYWGLEYLDTQLLTLERQYQQIKKDFNIETAMDKDYARKICMVSLMQDEALRSNDMAIAKSAADIYSKLTKDANLQPTQNTSHEGALNSISELVNIVERDGAIPRFVPTKDDIDLADITILDLKSFTRDLVANDESIQTRYDEMMAAMESVGEEEYRERVIGGTDELDEEGNILEEQEGDNLLNDILYDGLEGMNPKEKEKMIKDAKNKS